MEKITLNEVINKELKNEEFSVCFEKEIEINEIAKAIYNLRIVAGLTQLELAKKAKTTQPVIARLEKGSDSRIPSLELLIRIASAADKKLSISFH
jgi:predicted transcriptional regulator